MSSQLAEPTCEPRQVVQFTDGHDPDSLATTTLFVSFDAEGPVTIQDTLSLMTIEPGEAIVPALVNSPRHPD